ncbi:MAG: ABC transporter permease, partial [Lentisphaeria bacterium]|nr:ABC transporter permease [Lentisphaeria bacterium]
LLSIFDLTLLPKIIWKNRALLKQFVIRNVISRYRGSFLGLLWSFIQPLLMLCVYTFVFSIVFKARWGMDTGDSRGAFAIIMFCGMAVYTIFAESITLNVMVIVNNPNLVKKVIFPLEILPLAQVISSTILALFWFILLFLGVIFVYGKLSFTMLLLPAVLLPLGCLSLGFSYFLASVGVFIRDTQYIVGVVLQVMFFMTPIFYPVSALPEQYRWPLKINPLSYLIENCRRIFLYGQYPEWGTLLGAALISLLILHLGFVWFSKTKKGFADVL